MFEWSLELLWKELRIQGAVSENELKIVQKQEEEGREACWEGMPRAMARDLVRPGHGGGGLLSMISIQRLEEE